MSVPNEKLYAHMAQARSLPLPPPVMAAAKQRVLDTLAAIVTGSHLAAGRHATAMVRLLGGLEEAHVAGTRIVTSAFNAAWANGVAGHADESDDNHVASRTHPGCAVVPAALAVAERANASGLEFLNAVVLGYDICVRVAQALTIRLFDAAKGNNPASLCAVFGAAAAAGSLLKFDAAQMAALLSYAAQQASGIESYRRAPDHVEKAFVCAGKPARDGVGAALMVEAGFTAVDDVFAGRHNFLDVYSPQGEPDKLSHELGTSYAITRTNIKKWSVGGPVQAPLEGLAVLMSRGLTADDIARVDVRVARREVHVIDNCDMPDVCVQHVLGLLLADGAFTFAAGHDHDRMRDPAVLRQRAKIKLVGDPELDKVLPRRPIDVVATLRDGTERRYQAVAVPGTVDAPMQDRDVEQKALDLLGPLLGADGARRVCDAVNTLDKASSVRDLAVMLTRVPDDSALANAH